MRRRARGGEKAFLEGEGKERGARKRGEIDWKRDEERTGWQTRGDDSEGLAITEGIGDRASVEGPDTVICFRSGGEQERAFKDFRVDISTQVL